MKKAFVCLLFASLLLLVVSCNGDVDNPSGAKGSFPSWLEGKTLKVTGNASKAVLMEEDDYFYVTCSGTSVYVDDRQSGDMSSYVEEANVVNDGNTVVASTSTTQYVFVNQEDCISLEIKGDGSLDGLYSTQTVEKAQNWPLVIKCYEGPNQTDDVAVRIVATPRGLYYLLCSNYDKYKNGSDPFQCEKDRWFVFVGDIERRKDGFSLSNGRGSFDFSYGQDGSITLVNGESTFVLKEKSFDYEDLIKKAECVGGDSHVHNYVVKESVEPTCKDGYEEYVCECGDSYTVELTATGEHTYVLVKQIEKHADNGNSSGNGKGRYECSGCGDVKEDVIAHDYEQIEDPGYKKDSYFKNGKYCRKCKLCGYKDTSNAKIIYRDTLKFGRIEIKGETRDIEWLILKTDGDNALLISKYILYDSVYAAVKNDEDTTFTADDEWKKNPLVKTELNGIYYNKFFTEEEKKRIIETSGDYMFLLYSSLLREEGLYFDRYDKIGYKYDSYGANSYWLKDFNSLKNLPNRMTDDYDPKVVSVSDKYMSYGVRPCIWVKNWESLK